MDMDLVIIFSFITAIILITSVAKIVVKAIERRNVAPPKSLTAVEERLARIEQAVDAIAIEVERVSEGQRFTTRLLSDRVKEPQER